MAVNPAVKTKDWAVASNIANKLIHDCQDDFYNAISCVNVAIDSDRPEFLEACCEEFLRTAVQKVRLAMSVACVTARSVPEVRTSVGKHCLSAMVVPESRHAGGPDGSSFGSGQE